VPGRGGEKVLDRPVFNSMAEAVEKTDANATIIYVPARFAAEAALDAIDSGVKLVVVITEGIPTLDMVKVYRHAQTKGVRLVGPNCLGLISPGTAKVGILAGHIHKQGRIGLISRSGPVTYDIVKALTTNELGQSTCIGIGGDPSIGTSFTDALGLFEQ